jgi:para-aminobenzoate synthetase component 1
LRSFKLFKKPELLEEWRNKALIWASGQDVCAYANPNEQPFPFGSFREIIAAGAIDTLLPGQQDDFEALKDFHQKNQDWLFGFFGYDLKNQTEPFLSSSHMARTGHPELFFFRPKHLIFFEKENIRIESVESPDNIYEEIEKIQVSLHPIPQLNFESSMSKAEYLKKAKAIIDHIFEGDVYELNLCMEFFTSNVIFDPVSAYLQLIKLSPTPFSGFLRQGNNYLISASPERFMKKNRRNLISQPIKGTARRSLDKTMDEKLKVILQNDEKERAENMMIVDLVRNDLARSSEFGSVKVEEMFGIYTFRQWHQMVSTVSSVARKDIHWVDIIKNAFPMGSMTGAPKIKVMELIEQYENSKRGVYSGAFGYVTPEGDFDFNVIIRSLTYSADTLMLNFQVGSALTYDAVPEKEYEECLLKASAIFQLFSNKELTA